jgi:hypothetical protein
MARKVKKDRRNKKKRGESTVPRRRRDGGEAFKGMMVGGGLCLVFALLFFVRIGGETPFNHLLQMFETPAAATETEGAPAKTSTSKIPSRIGTSATNANTAPPLEKLTDGDKANLDSLIKSKTTNK